MRGDDFDQDPGHRPTDHDATGDGGGGWFVDPSVDGVNVVASDEDWALIDGWLNPTNPDRHAEVDSGFGDDPDGLDDRSPTHLDDDVGVGVGWDFEPVIDHPVATDGLGPDGGAVGDRRGGRRVVPAVLRSRAAFQAAAVEELDYRRFAAAFHAVRFPFYLWRLWKRCPKGVKVLWERTRDWAADYPGAEDREAARSEGKASETRMARHDHDRKRRRRRRFLYCLLPPTVVLVLVAWWAAPAAARALIVWVLGEWTLRLPFVWTLITWAARAFALVVVPGLWLGSLAPKGPTEVIVTPAFDPDRPVRLSRESILEALSSLGIGRLNGCDLDDGPKVEIIAPGVHRDGHGWRAEMNLPAGVTAAEVVAKRSAVASAIRRPISCVWPMVDEAVHEARLILYVSDRPVGELGGTWPLLSQRSAVDLFEPFPFGVDPQGRTIEISLYENSTLTGGVTGSGKTNTLKIEMANAAMDPRARLFVLDYKAGPDWLSFEPLCEEFYSLAGGPEDVTVGVEFLERIEREMVRRANALAKIPKDQRPDNKVTPALATADPDLFGPIVILIDEFQELFDKSLDKSLRTRAETVTKRIARRGRAVWIVLLDATQRPDAETIPTGVRDSHPARLCLHVHSRTQQKMILGDQDGGLNATTLVGQRGTGILVGHGPPTIVSTYEADEIATDKVLRTAYQLREAAGRLPDQGGPEPKREEPLIGLLWAAWPSESIERLALDDICRTLATAYPERVPPSMSGRAVADELRASAYALGWPEPEKASGAGDILRQLAITDDVDGERKTRTRTAVQRSDLASLLNPTHPHHHDDIDAADGGEFGDPS